MMKKRCISLLTAISLLLSAPCAAAAEHLSYDESFAQEHMNDFLSDNEAMRQQAIANLLENAAFQTTVDDWKTETLSSAEESALCEALLLELLREGEQIDHMNRIESTQTAVTERLLAAFDQIDLDMPLSEIEMEQSELLLEALESDQEFAETASHISELMQFAESEITLSELIFRLCAVRTAVSLASETPALFARLAETNPDSSMQSALRHTASICENLSSLDIFLMSYEENLDATETFDHIFKALQAQLAADRIAESAHKSACKLQHLQALETDLSTVLGELREQYLTDGGLEAARQFEQALRLMLAVQSKSEECFEACSALGEDAPPSITEMTLRADTLLLQPGDILTLTAQVTPENAAAALVWSSSNERVATVSNGTITAHAAGAAVISVSAESGVSASCEIIVQETAAVLLVPTLHREGASGRLECRVFSAPASQGQEANLIAAFYRGGQLLTCWSETLALSADGTVILHGELPDSDEIRIFLVESGTLQPLCPAAAL